MFVHHIYAFSDQLCHCENESDGLQLIQLSAVSPKGYIKLEQYKH